jgi:hypothetical protein
MPGASVIRVISCASKRGGCDSSSPTHRVGEAGLQLLADRRVPAGVTRWLVALSVLVLGMGSAHADRAIGYVQGRKVTIKVVDVDGFEVEERTASAFVSMAEAALDDGVELELTSGFRTHQRQTELYEEYLHESGPLAAKPGYSNHQSGHAVDINVWDWTVFEWLDANAAKYGFKRTVPSEPWHWEYRGLRTARRATRHR